MTRRASIHVEGVREDQPALCRRAVTRHGFSNELKAKTATQSQFLFSKVGPFLVLEGFVQVNVLGKEFAHLAAEFRIS